MKWSWHAIKTGLLVAEKVAVIAGQAGVTIKGQNPAALDAAAHAAASELVSALINRPRPTLSARPVSSPGA